MTQVNQAGDDINVSPLALDETYNTFGNTPLEVGVAASGVPALRVTSPTIDSILDNDVEFLGDAGQFTISQINGAAFVPGTSVDIGNGALTMIANGTFSFAPDAGFTGTQTFTYTLSDDGLDDAAGNADDLTGAGTVTITVNAPKIWYVDNPMPARTAPPTAPHCDPSLARQPLDRRFRRRLSMARTTSSMSRAAAPTYTSGIVLEAGQQLIGSGVALVVGGQTLAAAGTAPTITNASGAGITLATDNTLQGFTVGNTSTVDIQDGGGTVGTLNISNVALTGTGQALDIDQGGTLNVSLDAITSTSSTAQGIQLMGLGGTFSVAGALNLSGTAARRRSISRTVPAHSPSRTRPRSSTAAGRPRSTFPGTPARSTSPEAASTSIPPSGSASRRAAARSTSPAPTTLSTLGRARFWVSAVFP